MNDMDFGSEILCAAKNQGYHLVTDVGYYVGGRRMGPAERAEEYRAQMIDVMVDERQKIERRIIKDY